MLWGGGEVFRGKGCPGKWKFGGDVHGLTTNQNMCADKYRFTEKNQAGYLKSWLFLSPYLYCIYFSFTGENAGGNGIAGNA